MENRITEVKWIPIGDVKPNPKNRNVHPPEQIETIVKILEDQGFRHPLIVSQESGLLVVGHGRLEAAFKMGLKQVPVSVQTFDSPEQEFRFMVADNAIASWAQLDLSGIHADLPDLEPFDLDLLGIKDFQFEPIEKVPQSDEDHVPEKVEPKSKLGDLYVLGEHRLLCGDATNIQHVERLMDGQKADMVFTDPPYGVDYDGGATTKRKKLENDHSTDIYSDVLPVLVASTNDKAPFYIWHAAGYADIANKISENGLQIRSQIIWNKNMAQFGALSAQYKQKHEPCFYCHKKGCAPIWDGPTNEVTVWDMKRESKNAFHPTQKPVELAERAINNHKPKSVLDLFGGSGSTLIACEKTNRKCFMSELDPHYCDVIISRWQNYTGKEAKLVGQ